MLWCHPISSCRSVLAGHRFKLIIHYFVLQVPQKSWSQHLILVSLQSLVLPSSRALIYLWNSISILYLPSTNRLILMLLSTPTTGWFICQRPISIYSQNSSLCPTSPATTKTLFSTKSHKLRVDTCVFARAVIIKACLSSHSNSRTYQSNTQWIPNSICLVLTWIIRLASQNVL